MDADLTPDGRLVAAADRQSTTVWDTQTGSIVAGWSVEGGWADGVRFSPEGDMLVVGAADAATVFRTGHWDEPIARLTGLDYTVRHIDFDPSGSLVAIQSSESNHVKVWNTAAWDVAYELREHDGNVTDLDFSPNGQLLVTVSEDNTARVFDAGTGDLLVVLPIPGEGERFVRFAPWDPDHLIVASEDGLVSVLTIDTDELIDVAGNKLFRDFTPAECERFGIDRCMADS